MVKREKINRVCILTVYPRGGTAAMTKCFFSLLKELNYEVDVYYFDKIWSCFKERMKECEAIKYTKLYYLPIPFISQLNYLLSSLFLRNLFKKYNLLLSISGSFHVSLPFVIQRKNHISKVATTYYEERISKIDLKRPRLKYSVLTIELLLFRWLNEYIEKILFKSKYNKSILVDSQYTKDCLQRKYGLRNNILIFPFWVDTNIFKPSIKTCKMLGKNLFERYIFACGRFSDERKNLKLLLKAFNLLKSKNNEFKSLKLIVAGFKPPDIKKFYIKYNVDESVIFLGYISENEKVKYYQNASLFVLPSKQEGLGIVILEAMACGIPVVSTRCGGPESIINDGFNGLLTDVDEKELVHVMKKVLNNDELAQKLIKNGLETIKDRFSEKKALDTLRQAINKAGQCNDPH
jgi:glycosyltransferase involved in cell wall biosynthesis